MVGVRVHELSLSVAERGAAVRGQQLVADALRVASWPTRAGVEDASLVVIRRLDLGELDVDASPTSIALRVEERVRRLGWSSVRRRGSSATTADSAAVVAFADSVDAATVFVHELCHGRAADAWFWPRVLPDVSARASRRERIVGALLGTAAAPRSGASPAPAAGPVALVRRAQREGWLRVLLGQLDRADGVRLLAACGWSELTGAGSSSTGTTIGAEFVAMLDDWPRDDPRSHWFAHVACACADPSQLGNPRLPWRAAAWLAAVAEARARRHRPARREESDLDDAPAARVEPRRRDARRSRPIDRRRAGPSEEVDATRAARDDGVAAGSDDARVATAPALDGMLGASAFGGLLFVVPILAHLGIERSVARRHAPLALPQRVLCSLVDEPDAATDPALRYWAEDVADAPPLDARGERIVTAWVGRLRSWIEHVLDLDADALIRRPSAFRATRTHVDVALAVDDIDMRVRAAGLDVDPGWVPWLGRVVRFHYVSMRELLALRTGDGGRR